MLFRKLEEMKEDVTVITRKWLNMAEISILPSRFVGQIKSQFKKITAHLILWILELIFKFICKNSKGENSQDHRETKFDKLMLLDIINCKAVVVSDCIKGPQDHPEVWRFIGDIHTTQQRVGPMGMVYYSERI